MSCDQSLVEGGDLLDGVGLDVGVQQRAHSGLELLHVDVLAGTDLDLVLAPRRKCATSALIAAASASGVASPVHVVSEHAVGTDERRDTTCRARRAWARWP